MKNIPIDDVCNDTRMQNQTMISSFSIYYIETNSLFNCF